MAVQGAAIASVGLVDAYWQLLACMGIAGLAHTVYHPADYAILTAAVEPRRLGRAYGIHTFTGNVGFAIAPVFMVTVAELWHWRAAFLAIGAIGVLVAVALFLYRDLLREDRRSAKAGGPKAPVGTKAGLRFLMSAPDPDVLRLFRLSDGGRRRASRVCRGGAGRAFPDPARRSQRRSVRAGGGGRGGIAGGRRLRRPGGTPDRHRGDDPRPGGAANRARRNGADVFRLP